MDKGAIVLGTSSSAVCVLCVRDCVCLGLRCLHHPHAHTHSLSHIRAIEHTRRPIEHTRRHPSVRKMRKETSVATPIPPLPSPHTRTRARALALSPGKPGILKEDRGGVEAREVELSEVESKRATWAALAQFSVTLACVKL